MPVSADTRVPWSHHRERKTCHLPLDQVPCKPLPAWGQPPTGGHPALHSGVFYAQFSAGLAPEPLTGVSGPNPCGSLPARSTPLVPRAVGSGAPDSWALLAELACG